MSDKREGNEFPCVSCVFRWFQRTKVKCYVSVQVTYLLDKIYPYMKRPSTNATTKEHLSTRSLLG